MLPITHYFSIAENEVLGLKEELETEKANSKDGEVSEEFARQLSKKRDQIKEKYFAAE